MDFCYNRVIFDNGSIVICFCEDAEFFCDDILKRLLLSESGIETFCAVAISESKGSLKIRAELKKDC